MKLTGSVNVSSRLFAREIIRSEGDCKPSVQFVSVSESRCLEFLLDIQFLRDRMSVVPPLTEYLDNNTSEI